MSVLYRVTKNKEYLDIALNAQEFIEENLCNGLKLYTSFRNGKHSDKGFLDDYAFYIASLIELYNSTLDKEFLKKAESFLNESIKQFWDLENGGFYLCKTESMELFINPKENYDGAMPSGNSVMTYNLVRLYQQTERYGEILNKQLEYMLSQVQDYPAGHSMFLFASILNENLPEHITVVLKNEEDLIELPENLPLLANISVVNDGEEYKLINDKTTYYVCKNNICESPKNYI